RPRNVSMVATGTAVLPVVSCACCEPESGVTLPTAATTVALPVVVQFVNDPVSKPGFSSWARAGLDTARQLTRAVSMDMVLRIMGESLQRSGTLVDDRREREAAAKAACTLEGNADSEERKSESARRAETSAA